MRTTPRSVTALICFLSFFYFNPTSSVDSATISKKSRVQQSKESQDGRDGLSKSYWKTVKKPNVGIPQEYTKRTSNSVYKHSAYDINEKSHKTTECRLKAQLRKRLKSSSGSEWIINDETLKLLKKDPQRVLDCTQSGDRVLFVLAGKHKFKRTMVVRHELEFISKTPKTEKNTVDDWINTTSYTCPHSSPFLIVNSTFQGTGFIIDSCTESSGNGTVLVLPGAVATFNDVNVSNNKNRAFYVFNNAQLTLKNSYFKDNRMQYNDYDGGVIFAGSYGNLTLLNSIFLENSAHFGGAIHVYNNNNITIVNCALRGNTASYGGAIDSNDGNVVTIEACTLDDNYASESGGAIYFEDHNTVVVEKTSLYGNNATSGGTLCFINNNDIKIYNSMFNGNQASESGGAIYSNDYNTVVVEKTSFYGNNATFGGALHFLNNNTIKTYNSTLNGNIASWGGVMYSQSNKDIMIVNSNIEENHVKEIGGVAFLNDGNVVNVVNSMLNGNTAEFGGAIYSYYNNKVTILDSTLNANTASKNGGVILNAKNSYLAIKNTSFSNNKGEENGGVLFFYMDNNLTLSNTTFTRNNAIRGGAIFASKRCYILMTQSYFRKNKATLGGCLYGDGLSIQVRECECIENNSSTSGGCFYLQACNANLTSNNISLNKAKESGGGIYAATQTILDMRLNTVGSNLAYDGGGMALVGDSILLCISSTFENNVAHQGGGMYIMSTAKQVLLAQITKSSFISNVASVYGGGLVVKTFGINTMDCKNSALPCDRVVLFTTKFVNNSATLSGSIMVVTKMDNILIGCDTDADDVYIFMPLFAIRLFLETEQLKHLKSTEYCKSWKSDCFGNGNCEYVIGTFGWRLNLTKDIDDQYELFGDDKLGFVLTNVTSGKPLPNINISSIDALNHSFAPTLYEEDALSLSSSTEFLEKPLGLSFEDRVCIVAGVVGYAKPGNYTLKLVPKDDDMLGVVNLTVVVRDCLINEEPTIDGLLCQGCSAFQYNFNISKVGGCQKCPNDAICERRFIIPASGYWHKGPCQDKLKKCIVDKACKKQNRIKDLEELTQNETNCIMDEITLEEYDKAQCHKGYKGPLCGSCEKSYGLSSSFECFKCAHVIIVILRFLAGIVYLLVGTIITIKGVITSHLDQQNQQEDDERSLLEHSSSLHLEGQASNQTIEGIENGGVISQQPICEENVEQSNSNAQQVEDIEVKKQTLVNCWKITLNFFQVTSTAASMDVEWTSKILDMLEGLNVLGAATSDSVSYSIDCLISSASNATKAIWRLLFSLFVPNVVVLLLALHWGYRCFTKHEGNHLYFSKRLLLTVVTVVYITYFDLTQVAIRVFSCVGVHVNMIPFSNAVTRYWIGDTSIECYENTHIILMGIALVILVLVSICFPILCSMSLSQKRDEIEDKTSWTYETLGFLGGPFKKTYIYWECITMIKKALLSIIIVFSYSLGNQIQGLLILIVLVLFLYFHTLCRPYAEEYQTLNYYESGSLLISCVTYTLVQFFNVERCSEVTRGIVSLLLIAINGGFVCIMAFKIIREATNLARVFLESKNIRIPERANIVTLVRVYSKVKRSRFSSA